VVDLGEIIMSDQAPLQGVEILDSGGAKIVPPVPVKDCSYRTSDIEMATVLITLGHKCLDLGEKRDKKAKRVVFVFEHNRVREDLKKWLNGGLAVDPRLLLNNLSDLKNLVHNKGFE
jgi:hypothetical protein